MYFFQKQMFVISKDNTKDTKSFHLKFSKNRLNKSLIYLDCEEKRFSSKLICKIYQSFYKFFLAVSEKMKLFQKRNIQLSLNEKHNYSKFHGIFQIYYKMSYYNFLYINNRELQILCKSFGFQYGTIIKREKWYTLKKNYKYWRRGTLFFESIFCKRNEQSILNCSLADKP